MISQNHLQYLEGYILPENVGHFVLQLRLLLDLWNQCKISVVSIFKYFYHYFSVFLCSLILGPSGPIFVWLSKEHFGLKFFFLLSFNMTLDNKLLGNWIKVTSHYKSWLTYILICIRNLQLYGPAFYFVNSFLFPEINLCKFSI